MLLGKAFLGRREKRDSVVTRGGLSKKKAVKMRCPAQSIVRAGNRAVLSSLPGFIHPLMSIDNATVRHIARLARLAVDDADLPQIGAELARVLDLADQLADALLAGIEPMAHPQAQALAWREDVVTASDSADAFLALAPESRGGLYLVPKVIG